MTSHRIAAGLGLSAAWALLAGCAVVDPYTPQWLEQHRQEASAGFTGCLAADNAISNVRAQSGIVSWNVTCKAKTYICTDSSSLACAPVVQ